MVTTESSSRVKVAADSVRNVNVTNKLRSALDSRRVDSCYLQQTKEPRSVWKRGRIARSHLIS
jgi:hypothetical protein